MRAASDIDFSIIIPTRERSELLFNCLSSVFEKAANPTFIEVILVIDFDDIEFADIFSFIKYYKFRKQIRVISKEKSDFVVRDCNNAGAQLSTGKYIWILNDDAEIITQDYDSILVREINKFLKYKKDRILYVFVDDDIHKRLPDEAIYNFGTCFPILSRETIDCLNFLMPPEINGWGGDSEIWRIMSKLAECRYLDLSDKVKVKCKTIHNESLTEFDETQSHMHTISKCRSLSDEEIEQNRNKLNALITKFHPTTIPKLK